MKKKKIHVFCNFAMSVDGKISSSHRKGISISSAADRKRMAELRAISDIIVVGAETVRADNPPFRINSEELVKERAEKGLTPHPAVCIISRTGRLGERPNLFEVEGRPVFIATDREFELPYNKAKVIKIDPPLGAKELIQKLHALGYHNILVEGGGCTYALFFEESVLDDVYLTVAPVCIGGKNSPTPFDGVGFRGPDFLKLKLLEARYESGELFLHYGVIKNLTSNSHKNR